MFFQIASYTLSVLAAVFVVVGAWAQRWDLALVAVLLISCSILYSIGDR